MFHSHVSDRGQGVVQAEQEGGVRTCQNLQKQTNTAALGGPLSLHQAQCITSPKGNAAHLVLPAAHGQGNELVEEILLLSVGSVTYVSLQNDVEGSRAPAKRPELHQRQAKFPCVLWNASNDEGEGGLLGFKCADQWQQPLVEGRDRFIRELTLVTMGKIFLQEQPVQEKKAE